MQAGEKWEKLVRNVKVLAASPYGDPKELLQAAEQMRREPVDLIVLDCIGYNAAMRKRGGGAERETGGTLQDTARKNRGRDDRLRLPGRKCGQGTVRQPHLKSIKI